MEEVISPIFTIPSELRGKIFNLLESKDATRLRQVCHQFKEEVDGFVDFVADLDEHNGHLGRVLSLRLCEINVKSLLGPPPSGHMGTKLLQHPHLLRSICLPNSNVSVGNLHYLLVDSAGSLENLQLEMNTLLSNSIIGMGLSPSSFKYRLPRLTHLNLSICKDMMEDMPLIRGPPKALLNDSFLVILLSSQMEHLKRLRIEIRCLGFRQVSQLSALVLQLIEKSGKTLKSLDFDLIQGHGVPSAEERDLADSDIEKINLDILWKVNSIEEMRIKNSTAIGISYWAQILSHQKKLKCLETDILPAPAALFRQIILNNNVTLIEVDIGDLTLDFNEDVGITVPFDISVFCECANLRKLTLDRNSMRGRLGELSPELIHLYSLPESLEELNLNYFLVPSEDLIILFESLPNLQSLSLTQCGETGPFGVDGSVLQQILLLPSIKFIEISPLNYQHGDEEREKLNLILTTFDYPEGHSYFQLKRVQPFEERVQVDMNDFYPSD